MSVCYIIGAMPTEYIPCPRKGDIVIAADGGYANLHGIKPDMVVGDFDSLGFIPESENIVRHPVRKDDTDMMLAVRLGLEKGCEKFVICGGHGGRFDHTFANIQTLSFIAEAGGRGFMAMDDQWLCVIKNASMSFPEGLNHTVSVFALGGNAEGVDLEGLDYPLRDGELSPDFPLGVSNAFVGKKAAVSVKKGKILIVSQGRLSDDTIYGS